MTAGVYAIKNNATGRVYVGSSGNLTQRWAGHLTRLRARRHTQQFQADWDLHGTDSFALTVLEEIPGGDPDALLNAEQQWIDKFKISAPGSLYNVRLSPAAEPRPQRRGVRTIAVSLERRRIDQIETLARRAGLSRSAIVSQLIREALAAQNSEKAGRPV